MSSIGSTGCATCRRRKLKCGKSPLSNDVHLFELTKLFLDDGKPICERCMKANIICEGYAKPLHFRIALAPGTSLLAQISGITRLQADSVPQSLSLIDFKPAMIQTYLLENFVWRSFAHTWLKSAVSGQISSIAQRASSALARSNFANSHHQTSIKIEGSVDYGQVVQSLIPQMANPANPGNELLIIPILLLTIHDSSFKNMAATASHFRGLVQIPMLCGPEKFQKQPLRSAFETCRAMLTTGMLTVRKRCFLEEEHWRSVPWHWILCRNLLRSGLEISSSWSQGS